ncbi:MAG: hypothetical protein ACFE75_14300 [Candidatus Hodarchaeota archaeon]
MTILKDFILYLLFENFSFRCDYCGMNAQYSIFQKNPIIMRNNFLHYESLSANIFIHISYEMYGLFDPYFYLLFCDINSYLGETPAILGNIFNKILG